MLGLQASGRLDTPSGESMISTELSPLATSMFDDDDGMMYSTPKLVLKSEITRKKTYGCVLM